MARSPMPEQNRRARWLAMIVSARSRPQRSIALGDVLQHAEQVHALPGAGRGDLVEVGQRRDVADLVEGEQQRAGRSAGRSGAALVRAGDDVRDQGGEQAAEAALLVGGRDQVERVGAGEEPVGADPGLAHRSRRRPPAPATRPGRSRSSAAGWSARRWSAPQTDCSASSAGLRAAGWGRLEQLDQFVVLGGRDPVQDVAPSSAVARTRRTGGRRGSARRRASRTRRRCCERRPVSATPSRFAAVRRAPSQVRAAR